MWPPSVWPAALADVAVGLPGPRGAKALTEQAVRVHRKRRPPHHDRRGGHGRPRPRSKTLSVKQTSWSLGTPCRLGASLSGMPRFLSPCSP